jgi:hypothetical protein
LIAFLVQLPTVRDAFGIIKPTATDIGIIVGFGVVVFISMEVVKAVLRKKMAKLAATRRITA